MMYTDYKLNSVDQKLRALTSISPPCKPMLCCSNAVLNISGGLHELGGVQWQLALYLLLCWTIVFLCLVRGIYSAGKVTPQPYLKLLILMSIILWKSKKKLNTE